jgi:hypothetical protein
LRWRPPSIPARCWTRSTDSGASIKVEVVIEHSWPSCLCRWGAKLSCPLAACPCRRLQARQQHPLPGPHRHAPPRPLNRCRRRCRAAAAGPLPGASNQEAFAREAKLLREKLLEESAEWS